MRQDLTNISYLNKLLNKAGARPKRGWGQNFLVCPEVIEATMLGMNKTARRVTELGSGVGALTIPLLASGFHVRGIEKDKDLIKILRKVVPRRLEPQLEIMAGDMREAQWPWDEPYQLVGNIPYSLSGLIVRRVTLLDPPPERVVLMVQKEVGERLCAVPPKMSLMSLAVSLWGKAELALNVPKFCFWPEPKVDSQLILMSPNKKARPARQRERILRAAKVFFKYRRKQMKGAVKREFGLDDDEAKKLLDRADIKYTQRPQELNKKQWGRLVEEVGRFSA